MDAWVQREALEIARRATRELEALVAVSSPSGDVHGAEECAAICAALLPADAEIERPPCSSPDHAPDLLATLRGTGRRRVLLLGHVDTVVAHPHHKPLRRDGERLLGSGAVDMKGGVVLALGALRSLAARRADFAEVALLLVCDEEWRAVPFGYVERFAGWDACLCFEAGELTPRRRRGSRRAAQGGRHDQDPRARPIRAFGLGARARPQRAAGAGRRRAGGRGAPCAGGPGSPDRGPDRAARGRGVQRRARPRRAVMRPARRLRRRDPRRARGAAARDRRRDARAGADPALARHELGAGDGAAARPRERDARAARWSGCAAAAPATPATSLPRSRSRSTGSGRAAARRTTRASS